MRKNVNFLCGNTQIANAQVMTSSINIRLFTIHMAHLWSVRSRIFVAVYLSRPATVAQRRSLGLGIERSWFRNSLVPSGCPWKLIGIARWPNSLVVLIRPSPHHCSPIRRAPLHSNVKTSTRCFHWGRKLQSRQ